VKKNRGRAPRLFLFLGYLLYLAVFLVAVDFAFYRVYITKINRLNPRWHVRNMFKPVPGVSETVLNRLGDLQTNKQSSFVNFTKIKPAGKIRIGCFGDSFTYGEEVDRDLDYPSFLQRLFDKAYPGKFQVINFGSGWHGFFQSFMVWKYIGTGYDLDYVLLGPAGFQPTRDLSFNHTDGRNSYYMHSRYILRNGRAVLVDPPGATHEARANNYYSFLPNRVFLRYDLHPPAFINCLLPEERSLRKNPFYYCSDSEAEDLRLRQILLKEMCAGGSHVVLGNYDRGLIDQMSSLKDEHFSSGYCMQSGLFPYVEPRTHSSAFGNQLLASQMFDLLLGKTEGEYHTLMTRDLSPAESAGPAESWKYALDYSDVRIEYCGRTVGRFFGFTNRMPKAVAEPFPLIALKSESESIMDAIFFRARMTKDSSFIFKDRKQRSVALSPLFPFRNLPIAVFSRQRLYSLIRESRVGDLYIDGEKVCSLAVDNPVNPMNPVIRIKNTRTFVIRPLSDAFIDIDELPEDGYFYLRCGDPESGEIKAIFAAFKKLKTVHKFQ
jgi:hypothetical protein